MVGKLNHLANFNIPDKCEMRSDWSWWPDIKRDIGKQLGSLVVCIKRDPSHYDSRFHYEVRAPRILYVSLPEPPEDVPERDVLSVEPHRNDDPVTPWVGLRVCPKPYRANGQHCLQVEIEP